MWYDKYQGVPPANGPLESLFVLVYLRRQEAELLATRALVASSLAEEEKKEAISAFDTYCEKMFPFWKRAEDLDVDVQRKELLRMVKHPLRINMSEIYKAQAKALRRKHKQSPAAAAVGEGQKPAGVPDIVRIKSR